MKRMLFISRHQPTDGQVSIAARNGFQLVWGGDINAFDKESPASLVIKDLLFQHQCDSIAVVNPWLACLSTDLGRSAAGRPLVEYVGVFENSLRPVEGAPPTFEAVDLWLWKTTGALVWDPDREKWV